MPLNSLGSRQIRIALVKHLISPAVYIPDNRAMAFRIVWRNRLDDVWKNIYRLRLACDTLVKNITGSQFFFSSVSGLISKPQAAGAAIPQDIRPAISYYWVCSRGCKLTDDFVRRVMTELDDAELKPIQSHRADYEHATDAFSLATPLFTVLKDYNSSFVLKKIQQSASELYRDGEPGENVTISKLVIANVELVDLLSQCYEALMKDAPNLYVGLQTTDV